MVALTFSNAFYMSIKISANSVVLYMPTIGVLYEYTDNHVWFKIFEESATFFKEEIVPLVVLCYNFHSCH